MTRTTPERSPSRSPTFRCKKMDKENMDHVFSSPKEVRESGSLVKSFFCKTPTPSKAPRPSSSTSFCSIDTEEKQGPPPGSSKLLRKHFAQLGVTPTGRNTPQRMMETGPIRVIPQASKATMMESGPVRIANPTTPRRSSPLKKRRVRVIRQHQRDTQMRQAADGSQYRTPSKELLKSTAASRQQRFVVLMDCEHQQQEQSPPLQEIHTVPTSSHSNNNTSALSPNTSVDQSFTSADYNGSITTPSSNNKCLFTLPTRQLLDPVALTLWNDGREDDDMSHLTENHDLSFRSINHNNSMSSKRASRRGSIPLAKVSANLQDLQAGDTSQLTRPIPLIATTPGMMTTYSPGRRHYWY